MTNDDELERRLRTTLGRGRPGDRVDTEDFLARVHHGAKVRRVKRAVGTATAGVLVLAGAGLAVNAGGLLSSDQSPIAGDITNHTVTSPSHAGTSTSTQAVTTQPEQTPPTQSLGTTVTPSEESVTISKHGPIAAGEVTPLSLTATGNERQFVLAKTPGEDCDSDACASVFTTDEHGKDGSWTDLGQLPAAPPDDGVPTPETVSQLRFVKRDEPTPAYDGWAFGNALWSTHDSGRTWSNQGSPPGLVTHLEAWGSVVFAGVSSAEPGDDTAQLYGSPTDHDDWRVVPVRRGGRPLTSILSLAVAKGLVGLIDQHTDGRTMLYLSRDGVEWHRQPAACPELTDPVSLSAASEQPDPGNPESVFGVLWVTCRGDAESIVRYTDTSTLGTWHDVSPNPLDATAIVAAKSLTSGYVADADGIAKLMAGTGAGPVVASGVQSPVFFGFTNEKSGYLLNSDGSILSTSDGGKTWTPYQVSDTE